MLKLATIAANLYSWSHGILYTECFHPLSPDQAKAANVIWLDGTAVPGARVEAIWSPDPERSRFLAQLFGIPNVLQRPDEAVGQVDGVICADDGLKPAPEWTPEREIWVEDPGMFRAASWARPYIEAGTPVFLDKPLARSAKEAEEIISLAKRRGTLLFSASGIAHTMLVDQMRRDLPQLGRLKGVIASGPVGSLAFYGQHAYEPVWTIFGGGIKWVQNLGRPRHHIVHIGYDDDRTMVLQCLGDVAYGFHFILFGENQCRYYNLPGDSWDFAVQICHKRVAYKFVRMIETGQMPYSFEDMHEINKVLTYSQASLDQGGRRLYLNEEAPN